VSMNATPRQRQFGMVQAWGPDEEEEEEPEPLPICALHARAAERELPSLLEELPGRKFQEVVQDWGILLRQCKEQAPEMLKHWNTGVGPLLRIAAVAPRDQWVRSPSEPWAAGVSAGPRHPQSKADLLDDGIVAEGPNEGAEMLPFLEALVQHLLCKYEMPKALASSLIWNDGAGGCLQERKGREVMLCSPVGLQLCARFAKVFAAIGSGEKPISVAKEYILPSLTKKMVSGMVSASEDFPGLSPVEVPNDIRHVQPYVVTLAGPLAVLRRSQVAALGGSERIAEELVAGTRLGKDLGTEAEEEWASAVMSWVVQFADAPEFEKEGAVAKAVEWLLSQHALDSDFSLYVAGNARTPKKVVAAAERAAASLELRRMQTSGQRFTSNPVGIKGFVKTGVTTAFGSPFGYLSQPRWVEALGIEVETAQAPNSWHGDEYEPCDIEAEFMANPANQRRATVRIEEIMTFEYLQHVGDRMKNCLRVERSGGRSLVKYMRRVMARESSFWVMTITAEASEEDENSKEEVQEMLLIEVYNDLKVIHQAEGPHPRRWPRPDAWQWLKEWADQQGLRPDGPEGVTVGPYGGRPFGDPWDIRQCFLW